MTKDKATLLEQISKTNQVDLRQLEGLQRQLAELARAGLVQDSGCSIPRPLARPAYPHPTRPFANAAALFRSR